jgi:hypothetical protein
MIASARMLRGVVCGGALLIAVAACRVPDERFTALSDGNAEGDASRGLDAAPDVTADAAACFGTGLVRVCLESLPTQPMAISTATQVDTDDPTMCARTTSGAANYCVLAATDITIVAKLRGAGAKPLVLIASGTITSTAAGVIDVGSHRVREPGSPETGAGADAAVCNAGANPTNSGGGAGGSFVGSGGAGAAGAAAGASLGGTPAAAGPATELRGGCAGQDGNGASKGAGGHGGGAVFLIAGTSINVGGDINAAGEGGDAGTNNISGAGGGGSGGMIGLDAPLITVTSMILANGGGGGEGSGQNVAGANGADPITIAAALGGNGSAGIGGDGGDGSAGDAAGRGLAGRVGEVATTGTRGGGGGGGGGAGLVKVPANATLGTMVSPEATP